MNSDNLLVIFCGDDGEYRVYCEICDKVCTERYYKNHPKSQTHITIYRKIEQLDKSFQVISLIKKWISFVECVIENL